jgi:hypothetical protein
LPVYGDSVICDLNLAAKVNECVFHGNQILTRHYI